jgi:Ca2+-transporting ATPase
MSELLIGKLLLALTLLLGASYLLAALLTRLRIPGILGALFVAMAAHYSPLNGLLLGPELYPAFSFLANLGVLFLLFFIGLQIDMGEMRKLSKDIIWLTVLNTSIPFLLGVSVMLALGYGWVLAFVVGLTRMPTAEAVIVPILDEFNLIRTRVGQFIIGAGVLDDVIEVFLIAFVSVWIGEKAISAASETVLIENELLRLTLAIGFFIAMTWLSFRWLARWLADRLPHTTANLIFLSMLILFGFGGFAEYSELGMVVGAITAGVILRPVYNRLAVVGEHATRTIRSITYGFLGLVFFFWVGLSVDLEGMLAAPTLAILLYLAGTVGKLGGVFLMVPMRKINVREAWTIGVGLDARLTTEIIVAKLLLDAKLIDTQLFTALVTAASFTAITVPLAFTLLVRAWGDRLRHPSTSDKPENSHAR